MLVQEGWRILGYDPRSQKILSSGSKHHNLINLIAQQPAKHKSTDMAQKPGIPKGTRDFGAVEMARRNYIFETIRSVYALYGFSQIETPAMENLSTLMGKYGEEGDKLLFKILNSGDFRREVSTD